MTIAELNSVTFIDVSKDKLDLAKSLGADLTTVHTARLEDINVVFDQMRAGTIQGRIVMEIGAASH
ncbi:hypothetical protein ASG33_23120 [Dyadobacter sp. Leaf189]|nr:hypothetical protein ASG33_23120 [Dyadobacter sp. Leaf189]